MSEPECYRLVLESLLKSGKGKRIWTQTDCVREFNRSRNWVRNRLGVTKKGITVEALAMKLAKEFI